MVKLPSYTRSWLCDFRESTYLCCCSATSSRWESSRHPLCPGDSMKKLAILLLLSFPIFAQQINLGPSNPQVKGVLQPVNGGGSGGAWVNTASYGQGAVVTY